MESFINHVLNHANTLDKIDNCFRCLWGKCDKKFAKANKLKDHLRSHSKEKKVGCPTCGGMYSTNTKLIDHCKRQITDQEAEFKCDFCSKVSLIKLVKY